MSNMAGVPQRRRTDTLMWLQMPSSKPSWWQKR